MYDMIVIGSGAAGLTASGFAAQLDAKVALIEKAGRLGGDCTWVGCVPSKALLKVSKIAHSIRQASHYGITTSEPQIDMPAVRDYVQNAIQEIYQHETPEVFSQRGVEVIEGYAKFIDEHTIEVEGRRMQAKKFVIAVGGRPAVPPIPGLEDVPYYTNETLFDNDKLPERLLIIGAGPIGTEMSQAYARLGAKVTLMDTAFMQKDDPEVADVLLPILESEGVTFIPSLVDSLRQEGDEIVATLKNGDEVRGDMLLVGAGRKPNIDNLGLDQAGIQYTPQGIWVDEYLRTSQKHIYAVGDCTDGPKFTHWAGNQGSIAARNALFPVVNAKGFDDVLPWATFTDPEVAHVGLTEPEARKIHGDAVKVYTLPGGQGDRNVVEDDTAGFIKIVYKGSGTILGATIVAARAGEMIIEFSLMMKTGLKAADLVATMHAYPTYSDVVRKAVAYMTIEELFEGTSGRLINAAKKVLF